MTTATGLTSPNATFKESGKMPIPVPAWVERRCYQYKASMPHKVSSAAARHLALCAELYNAALDEFLPSIEQMRGILAIAPHPSPTGEP